MTNTVIAGYVRTPFHFARKGQLISVRPDDLAAVAVKELVSRAGLDPALIEDVLMGCAYPEGEQGNNIARIALLLAGFPDLVAGATINRFCGSSMAGIHYAAGQIAIGAGEAFVCAGVESMTRVPREASTLRPTPASRGPASRVPRSTSRCTSPWARRRRTWRRATAYRAWSRRSSRLAPSRRPRPRLRPGSSLRSWCPWPRPRVWSPPTAAFGRRPRSRDSPSSPAFGGTVTAGTASPLTDGAAAVLVCSTAFATRHRLDVLARIRAVASAGCPPELMGIGPVPATRKALARAGLTIADIDLVELNEAFASQAIACMRELAIDPARVNLDGGAIALGHPLGATGARITGKAAQLLKRTEKRYALATQCIGGGQGVATILEAA